jgi:hypothetical protein
MKKNIKEERGIKLGNETGNKKRKKERQNSIGKRKKEKKRKMEKCVAKVGKRMMQRRYIESQKQKK